MIQIDNPTKEEVKRLPNNFLKMCYNECMKRWRKNHKDKWNAIRRDNYKKHRNNITKEKKDIRNNTPKLNPLDILNKR